MNTYGMNQEKIKILNNAILKAKQELLETELLEMGIISKRIKMMKLEKKIKVWSLMVMELRKEKF